MVRFSAGPRGLPRQSFLKCSARSHRRHVRRSHPRCTGGCMTRYALVGTLVLAHLANPSAQSAEQDVKSAEQARVESRRNPGSALLALATDDHITVGPSGQMQDKKSLAALAAAPKANLRDVKIQQFGNVAIATGTQSGFGASA